MARPYGLLLAMMEPGSGVADEFQQWYDTEHLPERAAAKGFRTAARFVCIDGWPRYLALYDLDGIGVLHGAEYDRVTKGSTSRWAGWIMPQVIGLLRAEGTQIYPGQAQLGDQGAYARLMLLRLRDIPLDFEAEAVELLRAAYEDNAGTAHLRLFRMQWGEGTDIIAIVELRAGASVELSTSRQAALAPVAKYIDLYNVYAPYWRTDPRSTLPRDPEA